MVAVDICLSDDAGPGDSMFILLLLHACRVHPEESRNMLAITIVLCINRAKQDQLEG